MAAERSAAGDGLAHQATYRFLNAAAGLRACFRALWGSARRVVARLPRRAFWRGDGFLLDPVHGGLLTHYYAAVKSTPDNATELTMVRS